MRKIKGGPLMKYHDKTNIYLQKRNIMRTSPLTIVAPPQPILHRVRIFDKFDN
jgi:hypothetical protein